MGKRRECGVYVGRVGVLFISYFVLLLCVDDEKMKKNNDDNDEMIDLSSS